jgi:hypothetical protein
MVFELHATNKPWPITMGQMRRLSIPARVQFRCGRSLGFSVQTVTQMRRNALLL